MKCVCGQELQHSFLCWVCAVSYLHCLWAWFRREAWFWVIGD